MMMLGLRHARVLVCLSLAGLSCVHVMVDAGAGRGGLGAVFWLWHANGHSGIGLPGGSPQASLPSPCRTSHLHPTRLHTQWPRAGSACQGIAPAYAHHSTPTLVHARGACCRASPLHRRMHCQPVGCATAVGTPVPLRADRGGGAEEAHLPIPARRVGAAELFSAKKASAHSVAHEQLVDVPSEQAGRGTNSPSRGGLGLQPHEPAMPRSRHREVPEE